RFLLVFVGWIWGLMRLAVGLLWRTLKNLVTSPFAMLDSSSREPGVPWIAFLLLLFWSAIEATIFTFTLRPTMSELLSDLTGYQVNALALLGWVGVRRMTWFLFGRFGTPALLAILGRQAMEGLGAVRAAATADVEFWRGPINALKAEHEWFKKEAQHLMELLTLPVLQL